MTIKLNTLGTYATGVFNDDAAAVSVYEPASQRLLVVNQSTQAIDVVSLSDPADPFLLFSIDAAAFGAVPNSIAVSSTGLIAAAIEGATPQAPGTVAFFDNLGTPLGTVPVGATPSMLTFTPDGSRLLVANSGEPTDDYTLDPGGSISIIDLTAGPQAATLQEAGFGAFNDQREALIASGVRIFGPNALVAQDLEPESITISEDALTAYITLQENNALAVLDIATATVTDILPLGTQDHSIAGNEADLSDLDGAINIATAPVQGLYQPGAIASYVVEGETFLVLANEGASRVFSGFNEAATINQLVLDPAIFPPAIEPPAPPTPPAAEVPVSPVTPPPVDPPVTPPVDPPVNPPTPPTGEVPTPPEAPAPEVPAPLPAGPISADQVASLLGSLTVSTVNADTDGDGDVDQLFTFGSRSFSIRRATDVVDELGGVVTPAGDIVFDSGSAFEEITAEAFPQFFNSESDANTFDTRSDNSGPAPSAVAVGQVGDRTYAFTALESIGGVVTYDVTDPTNATFVQYINNRDFAGVPEVSTAGDLGPSDLTFIAAEESPTGGALLSVANAVSGSTTVYSLSDLVDESTEILINEIRINQFGGAATDEYFELLGTPNTSLEGVTYLVIGDTDSDADGDGISDGASGIIEAVVDLSNGALDSDGLFVAAEDTFSLGRADLTTALNFETNDNVTHLLVQGFTGELGQDLDIDDDGVLDVDTVPWTQVFDSVALVQTSVAGEQVYSETVIGPEAGRFTPSHVFRQPPGDVEPGEETPEVPGETPETPGETPEGPGETPGAETPDAETPGVGTPGVEAPEYGSPLAGAPDEENPGDHTRLQDSH
ncbi:MAG: choice-of-anchor I family protein, partial [Elainellaceae cyanobacterium]